MSRPWKVGIGTCITLFYPNSKGKIIGGGRKTPPPPKYIRQNSPIVNRHRVNCFNLSFFPFIFRNKRWGYTGLPSHRNLLWIQDAQGYQIIVKQGYPTIVCIRIFIRDIKLSKGYPTIVCIFIKELFC